MTGVSDAGFVAKSGTEVLDDVVSAMKAEIDPSLATGNDTVAGGIARAVSPEVESLWEALTGLYAAQDPDSASGRSLEALCLLSGIRRLPATPTTVTLLLSASGACTVPAGAAVSLTGFPEVRFTLDAAVGFTGPGSLEGDFTCTTTGPTEILADALFTVETSVSGWTGISAPYDGTTGRLEETDDELRLRRETSIASGAATTASLRTALLALEAGAEAVVLQNTSGVYDAVTGLYPHTYECVVYAPSTSDATVGRAVYENSCMGFIPVGSTAVSVTTETGETVSVGFSRAASLSIQCAISVIGSVTAADLKAAVSAAVASMGIGRDVIADRIRAAVYRLPGIVRIVSCYIGTTTPTTDADIPVTDRQRPVCPTTDVTTTITPGSWP